MAKTTKTKRRPKRGLDFTGWVSDDQLCAFRRGDMRILKVYDIRSEAEWQRPGDKPRSDIIRVHIMRIEI